MVKPIQQPPINQQIYTVMKQLYSRYSGQEIAEVIAVIRKEITAAEEQAALRAELKLLKSQIKDS